MRKNSGNPLPDFARYSSIGMQMIVIIAAGVFGGLGLDRWIGMDFPVFTVVLSLLSVLLALYVVLRDLIKRK